MAALGVRLQPPPLQQQHAYAPAGAADAAVPAAGALLYLRWQWCGLGVAWARRWTAQRGTPPPRAPPAHCLDTLVSYLPGRPPLHAMHIGCERGAALHRVVAYKPLLHSAARSWSWGLT